MFTTLLLTCLPVALQDLGPQAETRRRVEATFDPHGPYDLAQKSVAVPRPGPRPATDPTRPGGADPHQRGATPSNDQCLNATVVPGDTVTYQPPLLNTTAATHGDLCEESESCAPSGSYNNVYYSYTPDADGWVTVDTHGSNYDTILSVFDGCGRPLGILCHTPVELACNDDFSFGNTSQVFLPVEAGELYVVKVAAKNPGGGLLDFSLSYAPANDACEDATEILGVAYEPPLLRTQNAQAEICDPNDSCEFNGVGVSNTVWYRFSPPCDGAISVNTNGSDYDTVLSIWDGCPEFVGSCQYPNEIACDDDSGTGTNSQLVGVPVTAGQPVLIKVSDFDGSQGGGLLDLHFLFQPSSSPSAAITAPVNFAPACNSLLVQGTASDGGGAYVSWVLDYQATAGGGWTEILTSTTEVLGGTLAVWNTAALPTGHYLLRLRVANACGTLASEIALVYVDHGFDSLDLRAPSPGQAVAGFACIDGSAWDAYFDSYTVEYRPAGGGAWSPIDPATPVYGVAVQNDPLVPTGWNTAVLPDGDYELRLTGVDQCGNLQQEMVVVTVDNSPPVAALSAPPAARWVQGTVDVRGYALDATLSTWTLQVTGGLAQGWSMLAQGTSEVSDGVFASWNTSGLKVGGYTLRLVVRSRAVVNCGDPQTTEVLRTVNVGKTAVPLR